MDPCLKTRNRGEIKRYDMQEGKIFHQLLFGFNTKISEEGENILLVFNERKIPTVYHITRKEQLLFAFYESGKQLYYNTNMGNCVLLKILCVLTSSQ